MQIEGLKELIGLLKEKGWRSAVGVFLLVIISITILISICESGYLLSRLKDRDITFSGTVYEKSGVHAVGVSVFLEELPKLKYTTDSQGEYAITVKTSELKSSWVTIVFERPNSNRLTRRAYWKNGICLYHEIVFRY